MRSAVGGRWDPSPSRGARGVWAVAEVRSGLRAEAKGRVDQPEGFEFSNHERPPDQPHFNVSGTLRPAIPAQDAVLRPSRSARDHAEPRLEESDQSLALRSVGRAEAEIRALADIHLDTSATANQNPQRLGQVFTMSGPD